VFKDIEGCQDQVANREFESELLEANDETLLTRMLSHPAVDENDEIYRAILLLVKTQEDVRFTFVKFYLLYYVINLSSLLLTQLKDIDPERLLSRARKKTN
jgi:hypothetical protein